MSEADYPVYAVGSKYFTLGFKGAGASPIICTEPEKVEGLLKRGLCIIEPKLAAKIRERLERINTTDPEITIIVYGTDSLHRQIERATGIVLEQ